LSTTLTPYRPAQGTYARLSTAGALLVLGLFGCYRLYTLLESTGTGGQFTVLGMAVPYAALVAGAIFVVAGALIWLVTSGPQTGIKGLDAVTRRYIDLLIDTEGELRKVSWPTREDLTNSTAAVLVSIVLLGAFLVGMDYLVSWVMSGIGVLPK
jgi:preprotein translocase SecE subunit